MQTIWRKYLYIKFENIWELLRRKSLHLKLQFLAEFPWGMTTFSRSFSVESGKTSKYLWLDISSKYFLLFLIVYIKNYSFFVLYLLQFNVIAINKQLGERQNIQIQMKHVSFFSTANFLASRIEAKIFEARPFQP